MRTLLFLLALAGCADDAPDGFLEACQLDEDCADPELICVNVPNQFTGFSTADRLCTTRCESDAECPELLCEDWVGTDLECLESAETGGACNTGQVGEISIDVCGM